jgi:hypothetical protein
LFYRPINFLIRKVLIRDSLGAGGALA